ncbi:MAG: endo alpha-1,4 polygalactosaminidase [Candidatus Omnitrophica bacterium]|nr:endo alpha-1,4 polygalactosaminidase [Candidatus Omnitrophota bacterium]MDD5653490.1 endo alpha-1,4 polygalactosaminidase [Candidatus Omnitrophota bacterium]
MKTSHSAALILIVLLVFLFIISPPVFVFASDNPLNNIDKWFILLQFDPAQDKITPEKIAQFGLAILDPDSHPPLEIFPSQAILIAYISLGEAAPYRSYWPSIQNSKCIAGRNPNWGSYYVDVRDPLWQKIILEELVPKIESLGFKGLMLDTLDTAAMLEESSPEKFKGQKQAMEQLVRKIHKKFPKMLLISNNGFAILERIAPCLSGLLVEDIYSMIDFKNQKYKEVPPAEREYKVNVLKKIRQEYNLAVFAIDYVAPDDRPAIKKISRQISELGFKPYIAEKNLDKIYEN